MTREPADTEEFDDDTDSEGPPIDRVISADYLFSVANIMRHIEEDSRKGLPTGKRIAELRDILAVREEVEAFLHDISCPHHESGMGTINENPD